jgi:hypothetical protein
VGRAQNSELKKELFVNEVKAISLLSALELYG